MRPLRLRIENFASYRGQAAELDFAALELFAIAGPTGAGKSTLLDAIIFALYGATPRLGPHPAGMISLGADRLSVVFDFQVQAQRYRVTRVARRRGAGNALLEQLGPDDVALPLNEGVRDVNEAVARVVGLSYDAFTQAVVLPQGDFQKFLKSEPRGRREILSKILRLEIYERMRRLASGKSDVFAQAVQERERRLVEDYAEATPEALGRLTAEADGLDSQIKELTERLAAAEERRDQMRVAREKTRELEQRRSRLIQLQAAEPQIRSYESRLSAARRAAPVLPLIRNAKTAEENAARANHEHEDLLKQHGRLGAAHQEAQGQLRQATEAAAEIPALDERIAALDQVLGRMQPRPALVLQVAEAKKQKLGAEAKLKEARTASEKAEKALAAARLELRDTNDAFAAVKFDRALFETLDAAREDTSRITNLRHSAVTSAGELEAATARLNAKDAARDRENTAAGVATKEWEQTSRRMLAVEQELADARHNDAAALLRRQLRTGDPCPVCEHPVADHPAPLPTPALDALEARLEQMRATETEARKLLDAARSAAATAGAAAVAEQQTVANASQRSEAAAAELAQASEALANRVRGLIAIDPEHNIEEQLRDYYQVLSAERQRLEAARTKCDKADEVVRSAEQNDANLKNAVATADRQLAQHEEKATDLTRQIAEIDEAVHKVTQAASPSAERAELRHRRDNADKVLQQRQAAEATAARELASVAGRLAESGETCQRAAAEAKWARNEAHDAAVAAGFADEAAAAQAEITTAEEQRISVQVETHRDESRRVQARVGELIGELNGTEVAEDALVGFETAATQLRAELSAAERSKAELGTRIEILTKDIDRAGELRADLARQRMEHSLYHSLALDLRSDRFQAFLLDETFRELVSGASVRLWDLTKRYRFDWQNEAFFVVDHDNARQLRSADTLSGGETFLASLALALQLSEQVQKAAGATKLDSLFIDEGFGTLDPEALDAAASAIESLPVGGRMVGIISHIEELSLRLPARIRVKKGNEGSEINVEAA